MVVLQQQNPHLSASQVLQHQVVLQQQNPHLIAIQMLQ
jgi:hypothetical protein